MLPKANRNPIGLSATRNLEQNHPGLALKEFETALANAPGRRGAVQGAALAAKLSTQK